MPYKVRKTRGQNEYKVLNADTGVIHSHHSSLDKAQAQLRLLHSIDGGKLSVGDIQGLLKQSYAAIPTDYQDYILDKELSGSRVQVYKKKNSPNAVVVHRGTKGIQDMGNDLKYLAGFDISNSKRAKHSEDIQKKAEEKYCAENVSTLGHSLGSFLASQAGSNSKEIINFNKAVSFADAFTKVKPNEYNIRTSKDIVSKLLPISNNALTIQSPYFSNILQEHKTDVLDRLDPNLLIGKGVKVFYIKGLGHRKIGT